MSQTLRVSSKMLNKILYIVLIAALMYSSSSAQESTVDIKGWDDLAPDSLSYEAIKGEDGKLTLREIKELEPDYDVFKEKELWSSSKIPDNWYIIKDEMGLVEAVYGAEPSIESKLQILDQLKSGGSVTKIGYQDLFSEAWWPIRGESESSMDSIKETIKQALTEMVNTAVDQVCGFRARPTEFSMDAEVKFSLAIGASVKMGMKWQTENLCN